MRRGAGRFRNLLTARVRWQLCVQPPWLLRDWSAVFRCARLRVPRRPGRPVLVRQRDPAEGLAAPARTTALETRGSTRAPSPSAAASSRPMPRGGHEVLARGATRRGPRVRSARPGAQPCSRWRSGRRAIGRCCRHAPREQVRAGGAEESAEIAVRPSQQQESETSRIRTPICLRRGAQIP